VLDQFFESARQACSCLRPFFSSAVHRPPNGPVLVERGSPAPSAASWNLHVQGTRPVMMSILIGARIGSAMAGNPPCAFTRKLTPPHHEHQPDLYLVLPASWQSRRPRCCGLLHLVAARGPHRAPTTTHRHRFPGLFFGLREIVALKERPTASSKGSVSRS